MTPIVTPDEMADIDAHAAEPVDVLIDRAGAAVARKAIDMLEGTYGRRVAIVAGIGNNGADGRVAGAKLARRGVHSVVVEPNAPPPADVDLVIDAAYGTGFVDRGGWAPRPRPEAPVLAVDIPSGVNGLTGEAIPGVWAATETITFAAYKPGLVLQPGRGLAGEITVADIGLDTSRARAHLIDADDVAQWLPARAPDAHKYASACWVIAGSPGMTGAARLATASAMRAGAGYVRLASPGLGSDPMAPTEAVVVDLPATGWAEPALADLARFSAVVVGPGLGRGSDHDVCRFIRATTTPVVIDGDGLTVLGDLAPGPSAVLTPHDGEFERLTGVRPGPDRIEAARRLAGERAAVVLLKGPTTVVADPDGSALVVTVGDQRLATAGTGDVLAGIIGALLARGMDPFHAAAGGAWIHGRCGALAPQVGLVASDLVDRLPSVADELRR